MGWIQNNHTSLQEIYKIFQNDETDKDDYYDDYEDVGYVKPISSDSPYIKPRNPDAMIPVFAAVVKSIKSVVCR